MVRKRKEKKRALPLIGKPIIGITCEVVKLKPYYAEFELVTDYRYMRAILRAGGIPILLPINPFERDMAKLLEMVQGLVITGGADIHPSFYKESSKQKIKPIYRGRTYFELRLYREALKRKIPVLGICHGLQLINVFYGGTLYQDIPSEIKGSRNHRSRKEPFHKVEVQPGSQLHKIYRQQSFLVHSEHHQAIKVPGKGIQITAFSEDGVPEALEGPPLTLAVQWHPERQAKDPVQTRLFEHFIKMVRHRPDTSSQRRERSKTIKKFLGVQA